MTTPAVTLSQVSIWRWHDESASRVPIVDAVDWVVHPGETWALLGPNGAGKTTILTVVGAVEFPSTGAVSIRWPRQ